MPVCISRRGSDRATAYNISSKIIRRRDRLFIGWLNAPDVKGGPVEIRLGICHGDSGRLLDSISLGQGVDNHCGPALILDHNERFHTLIGSHHGPFLYRWSDTPEAEDTWSAPEPVGASPSYPALAADGAGTLHLAYRHKGERWQLHYSTTPENARAAPGRHRPSSPRVRYRATITLCTAFPWVPRAVCI